MHRNSILIRFNKIQQYAGIYLLQIYSTCFGCPSHPSWGVPKTVTAASGTGHITYQSNNLPPAWPIGLSFPILSHPILIKVSKVTVHKNLLSEEFCEIDRMESIQKQVSILIAMRTFFTYFPIFVKSRIKDRIVMLLRICEFRENMQRGSRTFLRSVNGIKFKGL